MNDKIRLSFINHFDSYHMENNIQVKIAYRFSCTKEAKLKLKNESLRNYAVLILIKIVDFLVNCGEKYKGL